MMVSRVSRKAAGTATSGARYPGADAHPANAAARRIAALDMLRLLIVRRLQGKLSRRGGLWLDQLLQHHVKHRRQDQTEKGDAQHTGEHRHAHGMSHLGTGAAGE